MKEVLPWILLAALTVSWLLDRSVDSDMATAGLVSAVATIKPVEMPEAQVFALADLLAQAEASGRPYLPFLNEPTLRAGLYRLSVGAEDRQEPHDKDEVYYVIQGRSKMTIADEVYDVAPGSVVFVPAHVTHRFHDIEEPLQLLVFFSEAPSEAAAD